MKQFDATGWDLLKKKGPHTSGVFVDPSLKYVKLYVGNGKLVKADRVFDGTLKALSLFSDYDITPKYIDSEILNDKPGEFSGYIIMTYVGLPLKKTNVPVDTLRQLEEIESIIENTTGEFMGETGKYYHNDISLRNFMVLDNKIRLIDLGLTSFGKGLGAMKKNNFTPVKEAVKVIL
jgi:hypothetical protein